jgi:release factor glutamine methyltransferase
VDARVLIPRPETEQLVQLALDHALKPGDRVLDVGTGSGCIALALKQERPDLQVEGCDLSGDALEVARHNAECLGLDVPFRQADLLAGEAPGSREVILSNPPYIDPEERSTLPENVREFEPEVALFAPGAGRELLEKLIAQAREVLVPGGHLFMETGETQHPRLLEIAHAAGWRARSLRDLAGRDRFIWLTRP